MRKGQGQKLNDKIKNVTKTSVSKLLPCIFKEKYKNYRKMKVWNSVFKSRKKIAERWLFNG